jgi:hypothetical protein
MSAPIVTAEQLRAFRAAVETRRKWLTDMDTFAEEMLRAYDRVYAAFPTDCDNPGQVYYSLVYWSQQP